LAIFAGFRPGKDFNLYSRPSRHSRWRMIIGVGLFFWSAWRR
jgi:hypothetical protein